MSENDVKLMIYVLYVKHISSVFWNIFNMWSSAPIVSVSSSTGIYGKKTNFTSIHFRVSGAGAGYASEKSPDRQTL